MKGCKTSLFVYVSISCQRNDIIKFLQNISRSRKSKYVMKILLSCIQKLYKSDIRSMINFMQSNQDIVNQDNEHLIL